MSRKSGKNETFDLPSLQMIRAASNGDIEAINAVLKHYEGYIAALSTRKMYDQNRQVHYCVDETLRRRLETKLITKILAFEIQPGVNGRKYPFLFWLFQGRCTLTTSYFTLQDAENSGAMRRIRHDCLCLALCDIMAQSCRALKTKKFHFGN